MPQDTTLLRRSLVWTAIYVVVVSVGAQLRSPGLTSLVLVALSVALLVHLRPGGRLALYGVRRVQRGTLPLVLFFVPLFAITLLQYAKGPAPGLDAGGVVSAVVVVTTVGFVEELLFRGFLLRALRTRYDPTRAVVVSGLTFGIGHVVNLLHGYPPTDQALQIVAAVLVGVALAYCVVLTGSLLPGAVFHALFNLSGTLTARSVPGDRVTVGIIVIVMVPYLLFLRNRLATTGPAG